MTASVQFETKKNKRKKNEIWCWFPGKTAHSYFSFNSRVYDSPLPFPKKKKDWWVLTCFVGHSICSSNIHVSHVNTSYGRFPLVQSLNIFVLVSGNPQQNTSAFGGYGKSGWNEQEQCILWIPLQCGVPVAKRANSYSSAMVMTFKTGESPSNGAPESGHPFQNATEFKTFALS